MRFFPFIYKHLRQSRVRTATTIVAMAVCIFLFCTLQSVLAELNNLLETRAANRLITRHAVSLVFDLPLYYAERIRGVPGVKRVAITSWFGGSLPAKKQASAPKKTPAKLAPGECEPEEEEEVTTDWSNFFPNMAVESEQYFAMFPEFMIPPDQMSEYMRDQQGAVIGRKLADKFNWKVGDKFYLESFIPVYRKPSGPFEFVVRAIADTDLGKYPGTDTNVMFFHYKYLYEATGQAVNAGTFTIEIEDPDRAGDLSKDIDALFENSSARTHTETEKAFLAGFISMAGNLALLLNGVGLAVSFTILLVTANTMSMAVRERRTEIAVLKTLGFTSTQVMSLIVFEALLLGALGGALGILLSSGLIVVLTSTPGIRDVLLGIGLSSLTLKPMVALIGFTVALLLGFGAGFTPAWGAYRSRITDMLRTV